MRKKRKRSQGQAMTEMVVFLPLLAILIMLITWIGNVMITRAYLVQAARYGTDLIQYWYYGYGSNTTPAKVKQAIEGFLGASAGAAQKHGRHLKRDRLTIKIVDGTEGRAEVSSFPPFPNAREDAAGMLLQHGMEFGQRRTIGVEVYYKAGMPKIFKAFENLMSGGSGLPDHIMLSERSEIVHPGCGYVILK